MALLSYLSAELFLPQKPILFYFRPPGMLCGGRADYFRRPRAFDAGSEVVQVLVGGARAVRAAPVRRGLRRRVDLHQAPFAFSVFVAKPSPPGALLFSGAHCLRLKAGEFRPSEVCTVLKMSDN